MNKAEKGENKRLVEDYIRDKRYFQIQDLREALRERGVLFLDKTLRQYLYVLKKEKRLFSAGRGWYSNLSAPFSLDTRPIIKVTDNLREQFPLLSFSCWSTAQLQSYFHHLQGINLIFVYAGKDDLLPLFEFLKGNNYECYLNPTKRDLNTLFLASPETIILRPAISEEPRNGYAATIEKVLVDLFIEHERLQLFDTREYWTLFEKIAFQYRIDMARLMRYAGRRGVKREFENIID